jgi:hypothetical protein
MSGPRPGEPGRAPEPELWIVQGTAVEDGTVEAVIADTDDVRVIRHIARDVLLLEMKQLQADRLKSRFGPDLLIERDQPMPEPREPFDP